MCRPTSWTLEDLNQMKQREQSAEINLSEFTMYDPINDQLRDGPQDEHLDNDYPPDRGCTSNSKSDDDEWSAPFPFLELPPELRNMIYRYVVCFGNVHIIGEHVGDLNGFPGCLVRKQRYPYQEFRDASSDPPHFVLSSSTTDCYNMDILLVNHQLNIEAGSIFYSSNTFSFDHLETIVPFIQSRSSYALPLIKSVNINAKILFYPDDQPPFIWFPSDTEFCRIVGGLLAKRLKLRSFTTTMVLEGDWFECLYYECPYHSLTRVEISPSIQPILAQWLSHFSPTMTEQSFLAFRLEREREDEILFKTNVTKQIHPDIATMISDAVSKKLEVEMVSFVSYDEEL